MANLQDIYKNVVWNSHEFETHLKNAITNTREADDWEKLLDIVNKTEEFLHQSKLDIQKRYPPSRPPSMQFSSARSTSSTYGSGIQGSFSATHGSPTILPPVPLHKGLDTDHTNNYGGPSRPYVSDNRKEKEERMKAVNRNRASPVPKNQAKNNFMADTMGDLAKFDKHKNELDPLRIFLPNISNLTTENNLRSAFAHYGKIRDARVFKKPDGTPAGKAIVWFESTDTVTQLLHKTFVVDGAEVKVAPFYTKSKPEKVSKAPVPTVVPTKTQQMSRMTEKLTETTTSRKIDSSAKPSSSAASADISDKCIICRSSKANCVLLWCGHTVVCVTCGGKLKNCPKPRCGQTIERAAPL